MSSPTDCQWTRLALMAALDGEDAPQAAADTKHVSECAECQQWLAAQQSVASQLQDLQYARVSTDLWDGVEKRIRPERLFDLPVGIWGIVAVMLGWRALQLLIDVPVPVLHSLVPLAAAMAALWLVMSGHLEIETTPELQKRGV